jgi:hypothetical protein
MKPVRRSRKSKQVSYDEAAGPLQWLSKIDREGNVSFVAEKIGYPGPSERISDEMAALALSRRRVDIVARYLRQTPCPSLRFRLILADMLEPSDNSAEEYRLKFVRRSSGSPKGSTPLARARAQSRQEHIGRRALAWGRHGSKTAQREFGCSASYVEKAKRLVKAQKNQ